MKLPLGLASLMACFTVVYYFANSSGKFGVVSFEFGLIVLAILIQDATLLVFKTPGLAKLYLQTVFSLKRDQEIRVAFSYLFRITIKDQNGNNRFLLVRNGNMSIEAFQPVGGVYKYHTSDYLREFEARDAKHFHEKNDLRICVKRKHVPKLLKKFESRHGRETSTNREFYEELIATNILPHSAFPWIKTNYLKTKSGGIRYSEHFQRNEILFYEIYELLPSEKQRTELAKLLERPSKDFLLATEDDIRRKGFDPDSNKDKFKICEHTIHIL